MDREEKTNGLVIAAHGRQYRVLLDEGEVLLCGARGKKNDAVCGDRVWARLTGEAAAQKNGDAADALRLGVIEWIGARKTLFYRSNAFRQKRIAANVDQALLLVATIPAFSVEILERCRIAAHAENISCLVALNKCDCTERLPAAREKLRILQGTDVEIMEISALDKKAVARQLLPRLEGKRTLLAGQSGMGKSTLINALIPSARAETGDISTALDSGRHTTTAARLYALLGHKGGGLIDSPGLQAFGLGHVRFAELEAAFAEFHDYLGRCRFRDCRHWKEPGCALTAAAERGEIAMPRLDLFRALSQEIADGVRQSQ
ncbi:MAG: ribosome small subunit-dependent GTPase A [Zoogloeaceae bacterium]|jgi:ribosome biogenesis GTPase|nr:ribosome small subunit-dependent GTPase A [Zoogloeaceae bacterium]